LDEPTAGVDALGRQGLVDIVRAQAASGVAVVLTTHVLADVEDLADRVIVLAHGRVQAEGTMEELTGATTAIRFSAPADLPLDDLRESLGSDYRVTEPTAGAYVVDGPVTPHVLATVTRWCADRGVLPQGLVTGSRSLIDLLADAADNDKGGERS
jgi:ABC-2 type transport system ATP-binding protein